MLKNQSLFTLFDCHKRSLNCFIYPHYICIQTARCYCISMVRIFVWPPHDGMVGHVALQTNQHHVSLWPNLGESDEKALRFNAMHWDLSRHWDVRACLVIHPDRDYSEEGCLPQIYDISDYVSDAQVNLQIESYLRYNGIDPALVTLQAAREILLNQGVEYCHIRVERTPYSFLSKPMTGQGDKMFWYDQSQSCVSFVINIIEMARPVPIVCYLEVNLFSFGNDYSVPWFEEKILKPFWLKKPVDLFIIYLTLAWIFGSAVEFASIGTRFHLFFDGLYGLSIICVVIYVIFTVIVIINFFWPDSFAVLPSPLQNYLIRPLLAGGIIKPVLGLLFLIFTMLCLLPFDDVMLVKAFSALFEIEYSHSFSNPFPLWISFNIMSLWMPYVYAHLPDAFHNCVLLNIFDRRINYVIIWSLLVVVMILIKTFLAHACYFVQQYYTLLCA